MKKEKLEACDLCRERKTALNGPLCGMGGAQPEIAFVGRNPGFVEDAKREAFSGKASTRTLIYDLQDLKMPFEKCWFTNIVKCSTGARAPSLWCIKMCSDNWLWQELNALTNLKLVVLLGNEPLRLFEPEAELRQVHGTVWLYPAREGQLTRDVYCTATFHTAAAFAQMPFRKQFQEDIKAAVRWWRNTSKNTSATKK